MTLVRTLVHFSVLVMSSATAGEQIPISPQQVENLGIRFESPVPVDEVLAAEATARVVIPPAGDAVIGVPESGLLTALEVDVGDEVVPGEVLAEVRSAGFIEMQRELLDALNTQRLARNELDRDRQLHDEGIISARRLQETTTRAMIADTSLNEHRQLLKIAGLTDEEIHSLETRQALLESLKIRAPLNGVVVERLATTGQRLDAMSPIYRLADLSELWLQIQVPQEKVAGIVPGMSAADPESTFRAEIESIGRAVDPATQSIIVRARVITGAETLRPGQFVAVRLVEERSAPNGSSAWSVPVSAVTRHGSDSYVFVQRTGYLEIRRVGILGVSGDRAYLDADFSGNDRVAISGVSALKAMWPEPADVSSR